MVCVSTLLVAITAFAYVVSCGFDPSLPPFIPTFSSPCSGGSTYSSCYLTSDCQATLPSFSDMEFRTVGMNPNACVDTSQAISLTFTNVAFSDLGFFITASRTVSLSDFYFVNCSGTVSIIVMDEGTGATLDYTSPSSMVDMNGFHISGGSNLIINVYAGSGNPSGTLYPDYPQASCSPSPCASTIYGIHISSLSVASSTLTLNAVNRFNMSFSASDVVGVLMSSDHADPSSVVQYNLYQTGPISSALSTGIHWLWAPITGPNKLAAANLVTETNISSSTSKLTTFYFLLLR
jgi:hypothetical protein